MINQGTQMMSENEKKTNVKFRSKTVLESLHKLCRVSWQTLKTKLLALDFFFFQPPLVLPVLEPFNLIHTATAASSEPTK